MTSVTVIVGHRAGGDATRRANLDWVTDRYRAHQYPVAVGVSRRKVWRKADAYNATANQSSSDVLVIGDADCLVTRGALAQAVADAARYGYGVPAMTVHRLTPAASDTVRARPAGQDPPPRLEREGTHQLLAGGGIVAVARDLWHEVGGFDPRFVGWGGEDFALGCAFYALAGAAHRQPGVLWHLWHPPQGRNQRLTPDNERLANRYRSARHDVPAMRALISEREDMP